MKLISSSWLLLKKSLFVDFISEDAVSIYDTESNTFMFTIEKKFIGLIHKFYIPENLGCIELNYAIVSDDFEKAKSLGYIYVVEAAKRPINLLPILNLQSDLQRNGDLKQRISLLGSKLALISGIRIEVSPMISSSSTYYNLEERIAALNQYCMYTMAGGSYQGRRNLYKILERLSITSVSIVDLYCNQNSLKEKAEICSILQAIPSYIRINLHMMVDEFYSIAKEFTHIFQLNNNIHLKLYADKYTTNNAITECLFVSHELFFFIYSNEDLELIDRINDKNIHICPVVLKNNVNWINSCVCLSKKDISTGAYSFNRLFRNMKLNANFFGIIDICVDGGIRVHGAKNILGHLADKNFSLIDVVIKELQQNNSWRRTRDIHPACSKCELRYLCPPLSIFELHGVIDKICK